MRILAIDPSQTVLKCLESMLTRRDHQFIPFTTGSEALRCLWADETIEAALVSAEQDDIPGVELCWQFRLAASLYRPIYVMFMSSYDSTEKLTEALDCGADEFIGKPPHPDELYARLRTAERVISMQRELARLATTDPLTGALNRRAFFERSGTACSDTRPGLPISAIMMDLDHFKKINDTFGHAIGDEVLRKVASLAANHGEIFGRLGGEEFAMIVRGHKQKALDTAEMLRVGIAARPIETPKGRVDITCSFGVAEWQPGDGMDDLLSRADAALYVAKAEGRNRVCADHPGLSTIGMGGARFRVRQQPRASAAAE
jgi:diguanylate cyclase (GGDEF)-like protein